MSCQFAQSFWKRVANPCGKHSWRNCAARTLVRRHPDVRSLPNFKPPSIGRSGDEALPRIRNRRSIQYFTDPMTVERDLRAKPQCPGDPSASCRGTCDRGDLDQATGVRRGNLQTHPFATFELQTVRAGVNALPTIKGKQQRRDPIRTFGTPCSRRPKAARGCRTCCHRNGSRPHENHWNRSGPRRYKEDAAGQW
jgi:hypothetical protein